MSAIKTAGIMLLASLAAYAAGAQSLSNILVRPNPMLATMISPLAANAPERLATLQLKMNEDGSYSASPPSLDLARTAYERAPLSTDALAIIALGQSSIDDREEVINAAQALSRRGRVLNLTALQISAQTGNENAGIATLNRLLLIYPGLTKPMLVPLMQYVEDPVALPELRKVLATRPEWRDSFFSAAPSTSAGLANLSELRAMLGPDYPLSEETEVALVEKLIADGQWDRALSLTKMKNESALAEIDQEIDWHTTGTIFGWTLVDESGLFARPNSQGSKLRIKVEPGQGGTLATRLFQLADGIGALSFAHTLGPSEELDRFSLRISCARDDRTLAEVALKSSSGRVPLADKDCDWARVTLQGRVWSTGDEVRGEFESLKFVR